MRKSKMIIEEIHDTHSKLDVAMRTARVATRKKKKYRNKFIRKEIEKNIYRRIHIILKASLLKQQSLCLILKEA